MKNLVSLALVAILLGGQSVQAKSQAASSAVLAPKPVYNEVADARAELNQALVKAQAQQKNVLVVFGANWCGDCLALERKMSAGSLAEHVNKRLVVLKVNVGRFDRNTDLAAQMGIVLKKGIPAVAVLQRDGEVLRATSAGELADARNMGDEAVLTVLEGLHAKR